MSFLNPVNEPALRFSSTDASAPQINYNARVAGDVKAILKACLVTGYGDKASAGWSIVNEIGHVAEFVSPSAAMSDYRLGIDDTSTSSTTWYYQYQNMRKNPSYSSPSKDMKYSNKSHVDNGWQLIVTSRGLVFIELVQSTFAAKLSARITYFSQVKSAIDNEGSNNILFFNIGHEAAMNLPEYLYSTTQPHFSLSAYTSAFIFSATPFTFGQRDYTLGVSNVDLTSALYLTSPSKDLVLGEVVGILQKVVNKLDDLYGVTEQTVNGRNVLSVCAGYSTSSDSLTLARGRVFLIHLDYWEY